MLLQTLPFFGSSWCSSTILIPRFMKGVFNLKPPSCGINLLGRYKFTWDVSVVLKCIKSLFPLEELTLKMLTFKLTALIALTTAPRAQTLMSLSLDHVLFGDNIIQFFFPCLLKTTRSGRPNNFVLKLEHYPDEALCVGHTLIYYVKQTEKLRKSKQLLISYVTYNAVCTSTIARWLKTVLSLVGIDSDLFKAHSYRSASVSAAYGKCSLQTILNTADWSNEKNFHKFYFRNVIPSELSFAEAVLGEK